MSFAAEAARFQAELAEDSRSSVLSNLFEYIVQESQDGRAPKEIEIAMEVFGKSATFDTAKSSMVRSHMHRLRQRLDKHYDGEPGPRLVIPKGEYRLYLDDMPDAEDAAQDGKAATIAPFWQRANVPWPKVALAALAMGAVVLTLAIALSARQTPRPPLADTRLWAPLAANGSETVIAVGDLFMVGESDGGGQVQRVMLHPDIQSPGDLSTHLLSHPEQEGRLLDRDIRRVPVAEAESALRILQLVSDLQPASRDTLVIPASSLSQDVVDAHNVIFIQYFSQLGALRSPVLQYSSFEPTGQFHEIRDKTTGQIYTARGAPREEGGAQSSIYDYGYIASFPGPSGKRNTIISGADDAGLSQMLQLVTDDRVLERLDEVLGDETAFEALYEVRVAGGLRYDYRLVTARPIRTATTVAHAM
ncbi:hypothetical protein [Aurantiacibacter rhizosphaerae]|uniref:Uncharacterized protein n=1 Tax=Aurantiacibacter rhizosphaerae TaxID=2691582 RepID=A0A844XC98_9SPHN|nr:hypothetical protein [Aurantiacibacter rhizosphaerae]MWV27135.1 hypothetical protein [Aurantiacibacter rhizosphaerae]